VGLHQNIADMNLVLRADLTILDATRIMVEVGPQAAGRYVRSKTLSARVDPVP
jgi:uncharacterized protein (DUF362 family)